MVERWETVESWGPCEHFAVEQRSEELERSLVSLRKPESADEGLESVGDILLAWVMKVSVDSELSPERGAECVAGEREVPASEGLA